MANKDFANHIDKLLKEFFSYERSQEETPVISANWPETKPSDGQITVTQGETAPLGEPREDLKAQETGCIGNDDAMGEVASLLITIGYILSEKGIIQDKFDTAGVLKYINNTFKDISNVVGAVPPVVTAVPPVTTTPGNGIPQDDDDAAINAKFGEPVSPPEGNSSPQDYFESRKLMENRIIKIKK